MIDWLVLWRVTQVVDFAFKTIVENLANSEDELIQVYAEYWRDEEWHEVLQLMAGMLDAKAIAKVLEYLMAQEGEADEFINLFLAAECLAEVKTRHPIAKIADELFKKIESLTRYDLPYYYDSEDYKEQQLVRDIRTKAVRTVANTWKERPETLTWLKTRATTDPDSDVRRMAMWELARGFKHDPETLIILKSCATTDESWSVRFTAVGELAHGFPDDPETLTILKSRATTDLDWRVRDQAMQELAYSFKDDPELFELLCDRAINDPFERKKEWQNNPRQLALEAILKNYSNHPQTLPLLRDRAENDPDEQLREWAKKQLEKFENRGV